MFIFKVIHSFLIEITSYFKGNPKSFEPSILRTETFVPKSCTYKHSFFGNRNPFKTSLSFSTQKKNQTHRAFSWGWWKLKLSSFWGSICSFLKEFLTSWSILHFISRKILSLLNHQNIKQFWGRYYGVLVKFIYF